jgi:hypothetical protein
MKEEGELDPLPGVLATTASVSFRTPQGIRLVSTLAVARVATKKIPRFASKKLTRPNACPQLRVTVFRDHGQKRALSHQTGVGLDTIAREKF